MQLRNYKYRIYPTKKQTKGLKHQLNVCMKLYNEMLEICKETYKNGNKSLTSRSELNKIINHLKNENPIFEGIYSQVRQDVRDRIIKAYSNFFRRVKEKRQGKKIEVGFPRFKKFYKSITYPQNNGSFKFKNERRLYVSKIGNIPIVKHREIQGKIKTMSIKRNKANQWFVIFSCEVEKIRQKHKHPDKKIGIDVGLNSFATLSDGIKIDNPRFLIKSEKKLKKEQGRLSRKKKGSKNRKKSRLKVSRTHNKISNQRTDFLHKTSRFIADNYGFIAVEKLQIKNMVKNHHLAKSINDAGWSFFNNMLQYKAWSAGGEVAEIDTFYPSSQICSVCGSKQDMPLSKRTYNCRNCGNVEDRDMNSAKNILKEGLSTVGQTGSYACGDLTSTLSIQDKASRIYETGTIFRGNTIRSPPHL